MVIKHRIILIFSFYCFLVVSFVCLYSFFAFSLLHPQEKMFSYFSVFSFFVVCLLVLNNYGVALEVVAPEDFLETPLSLHSIAQYVAQSNATWTSSAENGRILSNITLSAAKKLMGVKKNDRGPLIPREFTEEENTTGIPESFDSARHWDHCPSLREIRDQSSCGSCWAIAAASAITDRYCTVLNQTDVKISTASLLSCCFVCGLGCNGGWPAAAWLWWVWVGLVTEECQPYPFPPCSHHSESSKYPECPSEIYPTPSCNTTCSNTSQNFELHNGAQSYYVSGEENYQKELMANGPFEVALTIYEDFLTYKKGVYAHTTGTELGKHAVKLVGWGVENGIPYWKIANSWNDDWGNKGYFLIRRGTNECGIEETGVAGIPRK